MFTSLLNALKKPEHIVVLAFLFVSMKELTCYHVWFSIYSSVKVNTNTFTMVFKLNYVDMATMT